MPEGILGAMWAFGWGVAAASGALVGAILGLTLHLRHRSTAAVARRGRSAFSRLVQGRIRGAHAGRRGIHDRRNHCRCRYVQHRERSSRCRQGPQALRGMQAAALRNRVAGQRPRLRLAPRLMRCRKRWSLASPCRPADRIWHWSSRSRSPTCRRHFPGRPGCASPPAHRRTC